MIVLTIAFVSCFSWLRSGMERYADRKLSLCCQFFVSGFVGLLTYPFMCRRHSSHTNALLQPSLGAMTALPMTGFHRAQISLHGKQYFRITATFGILPRACDLKCIDCNPAMDSFRVRDSHPIPLFSEQECVSDCSGRAFATKAMLFSLLYARLILRTQKDLSCPAISQAKEVSYSLYIRFDCTQKIPSYTVGWLVGCKNRANYLHFYNYLPCLRTFPFQILHTYLTAI